MLIDFFERQVWGLWLPNQFLRLFEYRFVKNFILKVIGLFFLVLSVWNHTYAEETHISAAAGDLFELSSPLSLPDGAKTAFTLYMDTIKAASPLPYPFIVKDYWYKDGVLRVSTLCMAEGEYELLLGGFYFENRMIMLPSWTVSVRAIPTINVSSSDLLYPYPEKLLHVSSQNRKQSMYIMQLGLQKVEKFFAIKSLCSTLFTALFIFSLILPSVYFGGKIFLKKNTTSMPNIVSFEEQYKKFLRAQAEGAVSWENIMEFLHAYMAKKTGNTEAGLTSYELAAAFSTKDEPLLASMSKAIEEQAYKKHNEQSLDSVYTGIVNAVRKMRF